MGRETLHHNVKEPAGELTDYLDDAGGITLPDDATLGKFLRHNVATLGETPAYRFVDYTADLHGVAITLTWREFGTRVRAVAARLQQVSKPGDRVAICAPQGVDYVVGFFAAVEAGAIAVPLFAPELPGHAERLAAVLTDAGPTVILTTTAAAQGVRTMLRGIEASKHTRTIAVDAVPDSVGASFTPSTPCPTDIAYLQYTSGSTRTPAGVEISHRAVCTNVVQMIVAVGLGRDIRSVSWLPLYHDMGLMMIIFPALCGGQITLMSPLAFVRRPYRWIRELASESQHGPTFAAAPNFAFHLAATRGLPPPGDDLDLRNLMGLINGSEPVTPAAIESFTRAFTPHGLAPNTIKPSYGMAEATLAVATTAPNAAPSFIYVNRDELARHRLDLVKSDATHAVALASCGTPCLDQWAVVTDPERGAELPDGRVGEIWLHGDNIGTGYWGRPKETERVFGNKLQTRLDCGSHADGAAQNALWLRTGDLGVYHGGQLYITGRTKDLIIVDGRNHYPQDLEATASEASTAVRQGHVVAFAVPDDDDTIERLVIVAERAPGAGRGAPTHAAEAIRAAVSRRHGLRVADVLLVAAGTIPRTTSGKLARNAARDRYLAGEFTRRAMH